MLERIANSVGSLAQGEKKQKAAKSVLRELHTNLSILAKEEKEFFLKEEGFSFTDRKHIDYMAAKCAAAENLVHDAIVSLTRENPSSPHIHTLLGEELLLKLSNHYLQKGEVFKYQALRDKYQEGVESHDDLNKAFELIAYYKEHDAELTEKALAQLLSRSPSHF